MKKIKLSATSIISIRKILPIVMIALAAGILLTALAWLRIEPRWQGLASWWSLGAVTLGALWLKCTRPNVSRLALTLAVFAGVALVYLFPELFSPGCNGMPKAFAACPASCQIQTCSQWVAEGDTLPNGNTCNPSHPWDLGCCVSYTTTCDPDCNTGGGGGGGGPTPPTITGSLDCANAGNGGWCHSGLSLDLTATDPQNGTILISGTLNGTPFACNNGNPAQSPVNCSIPLPQGTGTAHFTATASSGLTDTGSKNWKLDSTPPAASGSLSGSLGSGGWYVSAVTFNGTGSDSGSGLAGVTCTLDTVATACSSSTGANGAHTLVVTSTDNAGNVATATRSFSIDTQGPTLNSSISGSAGSSPWYTAATLNASTTDPAPSSGAPSLQYAVDGGAWTSFPAGGSFTIPDGKHTLDVRAVDGAGNITQAAQASAWVDSVAPAITVGVTGTSGANGWYTSNAQVSASASDATSGVSTFEYSLDNGNSWAAYTAPLTLADGVHTVSFYAEDAAGRSTQVDRTVQVDTQAPQISGSLSGTPGANGWYISNVTLSAAASDPGPASGLAAFTYILDGGVETTYTGPLTLTDGQHTLVLKARDQAGLTDSSTQNIKVDTLAPALAVSGVLPEWVQGTLTLNGTAADAGSGLLKVEVSTDNGASWHSAAGLSAWSYAWDTQSGLDGAYTVRVRTTDYAGLGTQSPFIAQVDNSAPHIELPAEWNIWDTVTFDAWDHDSGLAAAEITISDPQDRWPKRHLAFYPGQLPVGLKWDRRFADGTVAPLGDYQVDAWASNKLGNSRHVTATLHINLAGSLFPPPDAATPLPPAQPTATSTPTAPVATLTVTPQSTSVQSTVFGAPTGTPGPTPTPTSLPVLRPTPTQTDIITMIQSFFSLPPAATETVSDFESDITPFGGPGPSMFAAAQTDPGQMAGNIVFGGAATAAIATFAAYIEQKKREEEQAAAEAAARRRETARERHMDPDERAAHELHDAIAAVTAKEEKEWKAERYEQISKTDEYKNSNDKTAFMHNGLEKIKEAEADYREKKKEAEAAAAKKAAEEEAARKAAEEAAKVPPMPAGLSPEAQAAYMHSPAAAQWIAANATAMQQQYVEDQARERAAEAQAVQAKGAPAGLSPEAQAAFMHSGQAALYIAANAGALQAQYAEELASQKRAQADVIPPGPPAPAGLPTATVADGLVGFAASLVSGLKSIPVIGNLLVPNPPPQVTDFLLSMGDSSVNPVSAAFGKQFWDGADGWAYALKSSVNLAGYNANALIHGQWDDLGNGLKLQAQASMGMIQANLEFAKDLAVGVVTTPFRIPGDIAAFAGAVSDRWQGKRGAWDVLLTGANLDGDIAGTYGMANAVGLVDSSAANAGLSKAVFGKAVPDDLLPAFFKDTFLNDGANQRLLNNLLDHRAALPSAKMTAALKYQDAIGDFPKLALYPPNSPMRLTPEEFKNNPAAQQEMFDIASDMRAKQEVFAQDLLNRLGIEGKASSILKRETLAEFVDGVLQKTARNGYDYVGQMDDMSRGRFDLKAWNDVKAVRDALATQSEFEAIGGEPLRRLQPNGGYGYPRYHVVVEDPETLITHEWQVGTKASTDFFETRGITISDEVKSSMPDSMHNNLHDIEYDIFRSGINKKFPEISQKYEIPEFLKKVDQFASETGLKGEKLTNLQEMISEAHADASKILQNLVDGEGLDFIKKFYH